MATADHRVRRMLAVAVPVMMLMMVLLMMWMIRMMRMQMLMMLRCVWMRLRMMAVAVVELLLSRFGLLSRTRRWRRKAIHFVRMSVCG